MSVRVFSYGSNMSTPRLLERVPGATTVGRARLPGFALRFGKRSKKDGSGKAYCHPLGEGHEVWGVLFDVPDDQKDDLDRFEGLGYGYRLDSVAVLDDRDDEHEVVMYQAEGGSVVEGLLPYDWYLQHIIYGAREHDLPTGYVHQLEAFESLEDPDGDRQRKELSIYDHP